MRLSAKEVRPANAFKHQTGTCACPSPVTQDITNDYKEVLQLSFSLPHQGLRARLGLLQGCAEIYRARCQRDVDNFVAYLGPARRPAPRAPPATERGAQPDRAPAAQAFAAALAAVPVAPPGSSGQDPAAQAFAHALASVSARPRVGPDGALPAQPDQARQGAWRQAPSNGAAAPAAQPTRGSRWGRYAEPDLAREGPWRQPPPDATAGASLRPGQGAGGLSAPNQAPAAPRRYAPMVQDGAADAATANGSRSHACASAETACAAAAADGCPLSNVGRTPGTGQLAAGACDKVGAAEPWAGGTGGGGATLRGSWQPRPRRPNPGSSPGGALFLDARDPPDAPPLLLFDLNGTLTSHTTARRSAGRNSMRPGTHHLRRLQARLAQSLR